MAYNIKCLDLLKSFFFTTITLFSFKPLSVNPLEYVSVNNQECKTIRKIINIHNSEPVFYLVSIKVKTCSGNCNNINDPYAKLCVPHVANNINIRVVNLM